MSASAVTNTTLVVLATIGTAIPTFTITGSQTPTSYAATGLPAGLSVNTSTGAITGTPTGSGGIYNAVITATNGTGSGSQGLLFAVQPASPAGAALASADFVSSQPVLAGATFTGKGYWLPEGQTTDFGEIFVTSPSAPTALLIGAALTAYLADIVTAVAGETPA